MIYLDTHVIVWMYAGKIDTFTEQTKKLINTHEVFISPIVRLELQYLFEIQRVMVEPKEIIFDLSDRIGLELCDKNFNTIVSKAFNFSWTRDPFDRIIVATAAINQDILVTKDQTILKNYKQSIW